MIISNCNQLRFVHKHATHGYKESCDMPQHLYLKKRGETWGIRDIGLKLKNLLLNQAQIHKIGIKIDTLSLLDTIWVQKS